MSRRDARITALMGLFSLDYSEDGNPEQIVTALSEEEEHPLRRKEDQAYAMLLVEGTRKHLAEIDQELNGLAKEWEVPRMAGVDRNLLRLADFEMFYSDEKIPPAVAINEAVEIAKIFGGDESPQFVNGLLGTLVKKHGV